MIERGRYNKTEISERKCPNCKVIEDEVHFLIKCDLYKNERANLFECVLNISPQFANLSDNERLCFLLSAEDVIIKAVGKFCHEAFNVRLALS